MIIIKFFYYNYLKLYSFVFRYVYKWVILSYVKSHKGELFVGGHTKLTRTTILNRNPNFNGMVVSGGGIVNFGDNFHSGSNCLIITSFHNYNSGKTIPYDDTYINKDVLIEDNVWLGSNVIILGGVTIGEGSIVQAGAVVVKSIPPLGIAGGNPAIVFKYRDREHYYKCKENRLFH
jgi:acetyltransferase-like isoleucine patch superfamily enzyme